MREEAGHPGEDAAGRRSAGELEAAVLAVLQAAGSPLSPGEVRDRLGGDLAYTTVVTILSRLHAKGVLGRRKAGRAARLQAGMGWWRGRRGRAARRAGDQRVVVCGLRFTRVGPRFGSERFRGPLTWVYVARDG